jgi:hypothetical protein
MSGSVPWRVALVSGRALEDPLELDVRTDEVYKTHEPSSADERRTHLHDSSSLETRKERFVVALTEFRTEGVVRLCAQCSLDTVSHRFEPPYVADGTTLDQEPARRDEDARCTGDYATRPENSLRFAPEKRHQKNGIGRPEGSKDPPEHLILVPTSRPCSRKLLPQDHALVARRFL